MIAKQKKEWGFGKRGECPDDEIRYCYWYEYARERWNLGDPHDWSKTFSLLSFFPEWPATPWLKIRPAIRQKRVRLWQAQQRTKYAPALAELEKHTIIEANPDVLRDVAGVYQSSVFKDNEVWLGEKPADGSPTKFIKPVPKDHLSWKCHSYFVHKVDWRESWEENKSRFKEWFEANKPKDFEQIQRVNWRGATCWEGLRALAARRFVDTYGFNEAIEAAKKYFGQDAYNGDRKTWKDALSRADEHLATFYRDSRSVGI